MQIKENIKAPRHWPLCGEFTGTGEFPAQRASYAENVSIWWRHHDHGCCGCWCPDTYCTCYEIYTDSRVNYLCHCWVDKCKKQIIYYASWKHQAYTEISLCIFPSYRILIMYTAGGEWGIFVYLDVRGNVLQGWYILHFLWNAKKCFYMCRE